MERSLQIMQPLKSFLGSSFSLKWHYFLHANFIAGHAFGRRIISRREAGRGGRRGLCGRSSRTQKDVERLPTSHLFLLTPSLFLQPAEPFFLPPLGLFLLLVLPTLVEILHHHPHKHVEDEEGHNQQERNEVEEHPWIVVHDWLQSGGRQISTESQKEEWEQIDTAVPSTELTALSGRLLCSSRKLELAETF